MRKKWSEGRGFIDVLCEGHAYAIATVAQRNEGRANTKKKIG